MRLRLLTGTILFILLSACSMPAITDSANASTSDNSRALTILDHHLIPHDAEINGLKVIELSGLAWDNDEQLLYAVSDRGRIYHFRLEIQNDLIKSVTPVFAAELRNMKNEKLRGYHGDAEGLMAWNANNGKKGDTQLIISLERESRIVRFTPQGKALKNIPVPEPLQDHHQFRASNSGLESVTYHPKYGFITAPEESLKDQPKNIHTVYTADKQWSFMAYPAPNSSITALEIIPESNYLLVLERAWSGFLNPMVISLRRVNLDQCSKQEFCQVENLKVFSSSLSIDNFEGMTALGDQRYLIVSDDGEHDLLRTLLTLFKIN